MQGDMGQGESILRARIEALRAIAARQRFIEAISGIGQGALEHDEHKGEASERSDDHRK